MGVVAEVRQLGALGDGTTDDWPAFQAAVALLEPAGGTLRVPAGDYVLSREVAFDRGDTTVECEGGARLIVGGPEVKLFHFRGDHSKDGRMRNIRVSGCRFYDPAPLEHATSEESHGIVLVNVDRAILRDLEFVDLGDEAVDIIFSTEVQLLDSRARGGCAAVRHPHSGTFSVNGSSRVQIRGNVIEQNANGSAIRVEVNAGSPPSDHVIIADNQIFEPEDRNRLGLASGTGIHVTPAHGDATAVTITGNQIVRPYRYGILVHPVFSASTRGLVIQSNTVLGGGEGILSEPASRRGAIAVIGRSSLGVVSGNVVHGWGGTSGEPAGIRITGEGIAVTGNVVNGIAGPGIDLRSGVPGHPNLVVGNLLAGTRGVRLEHGVVSGLNGTDVNGPACVDGLANCNSLRTEAKGGLTRVP